MESVRTYFNGTGFERWNKIYGETDDVNKVRRPRLPSPFRRQPDVCCRLAFRLGCHGPVALS